MNENKHTPEPWRVVEAENRTILIVAPWSDQVRPERESGYGDYRGLYIASCEHQDDNPCVSKEAALTRMRRIVACVNACAGIETGHLEKYGLPDFAQKISDLREQRDELLAALVAARRLIELISPFEGDVTRQIDKAIAAGKDGAA